MEKLKLIIISLIPLLLVSIIGFGIYNNLDSTKVKTICKNLKFIDVNIHHNQALDAIELAKKQGIEIPDTIINFDTHSDVYVYQGIDEEGAHIFDWLNEFLAKNTNATTLYWVMPEEEATNEKILENLKDTDIEGRPIAFFGNSKKPANEVNPQPNKLPYIQDFLVDTKTSYMEEIVSEKDKEKLKNPRYKSVKLIICTENTLPNFKGKNVILSLDMDYISNSGFDTLEAWKHNRNREEIDTALSKMLTTIRNRNIKPEIISISLSPQYVPKKDREQLTYFIEFVLKISGKQDILREYTRTCNSPQVKPGQKKYEGI